MSEYRQFTIKGDPEAEGDLTELAECVREHASDAMWRDDLKGVMQLADIMMHKSADLYAKAERLSKEEPPTKPQP
jgi:hypothetical protein